MKIIIENEINYESNEWIVSLCDEEGCDSYCGHVCCDDSEACGEGGCHWF